MRTTTSRPGTPAGVGIVLGGRGGQGILLASEILAEAAVRRGVEVLGSETHGMAQRGGSVVSHVKVGKGPGPLVGQGEADVLISLERVETYRNLPILRNGGACFANFAEADALDPRVKAYLEKAGISFHRLDADKIAAAAGVPQGCNVVLIGLFASWPSCPFSRDELRAALEAKVPEKFRAKNLDAFERGCAAGKALLSGPA
jgi:indolepyruvate ferredoxin oxidoreductase, beta subunit